MEGAERDARPGAPDNVADLIDALDRAAHSLPKRLVQCATFTRRHLHLLAVSTVAEMAEAAGVAPSVYMRFCKALGYSGYSQMQAPFRRRYTDFRPRYDERPATTGGDGTAGADLLLAEFAEAAHQSLLSLANTATSDTLDRIARDMGRARAVHLVGARRAFAVVGNMAYLLDRIGIATSLTPAPGLVASALRAGKQDVVFAVTFAPFSPETVALAEGAAGRGATVHALSDSERCPLAACADTLLIAREGDVADVRGLAAAITLTTALCVAAGTHRRALDKPNGSSEAE